MSNLIKSSFVAFANNETLIVDTNNHKIVREIETASIKKDPNENIDDLEIEDILGGSIEDDEDESMQEDFTELIFGEEQEEIIQQSPEEIVTEAIDEAAKILNDAREQAIVMSQEAKEDGYNQGYNDGIEAANEEATLIKQQANDEYEAAMNAITVERESMIKAVEEGIVEIACGLIEKLTGIVVEDNSEVMLYIINNAVKNVENSRNFIIRVNDDDYVELSESKDKIYGALNPSVTIELFADSKLQEGQCIIETDNGLIDCSIDVQIANITTALKLLSRT